MTENEMLATEYFEHEMYKTQNNMFCILRNKSQMTDDEFSKMMHTELTRYDKCKEMRDYYIRDCNVLEKVYNVSNK